MNRHALTAAFAGTLLLSATGAAAGAAIPLEPSSTPNTEATAAAPGKPTAQDVVSTGSAAGQAFCVISGSAISLLGSTHLTCTP
ncbi:hypothetical protein [Nocardia sp. BMG111209]|uniref:hypothetical protein n=1 Tax=Nocardia sp. BMG111209 TaxID=1160137 RepID=UPI0012DF400E|nr:hypothetical protein [Nocardia sp. BMG111209]